MKTSKHYVLATLGLAVMAGSLVLSGSNAGYAAPPPGKRKRC